MVRLLLTQTVPPIKVVVTVCVVLTLLLGNLFVSIAYTYPYADSKSFALNFLMGIAGVNVNNYQVSINVSTGKMPLSQHDQTDISVELLGKSNDFQAIFTFIDGKFCIYHLYLLSGTLDGSEQNYKQTMLIAKKSIETYGGLFNASYCSELTPMIAMAATTGDSITETGNIVQTVSQTGASLIESTKLQWFIKVKDNYTIPYRSLSMSISKTGIVSGIMDNLILYHVATTDILVSETQAVNRAMQYIEAYANKHEQKVMSVNVTLSFTPDIDSKRGDDFAIYPLWTVKALFDKRTESVYGYGVSIWADNGEVAYFGPGMSFGPLTSGDNTHLWFIIGIVPAALAFVCLGTYFKRKEKNRRRIKE